MRLSKYSALILLTLALSACGGGGGGGTVASNTPSDSGGTGTGGGGGGTGGGGGGTGTGGGGGTSPGGGGTNPIDPTAGDVEKASQAEMAAEAAEVRVSDTLQDSSIVDFQAKTTLSRAMGVSAGIATDAHTDLAEIQREIDAIEGHRQTAEDAYNNLMSEAERLEMEAQELEKQAQMAMDAEITFNQAAIDSEEQASALRLQLDSFENQIATDEETAANEDGYAEDDDAEADRRANLNPSDPEITKYREMAEEHRMAAAARRAAAEAIRMDPEYIRIKRETEAAVAVATAKRMEAEAKSAEADNLQAKADMTSTDAVTKEEEADTAKGHLDEIEDIKADLEASLVAWKGFVGEDAAAAEHDKAALVLALLEGLPGASTGVIADLYKSGNHVFARSERPAGTMTFEDIANGKEAWVFHRRSFTTDGTTINDGAHTRTGLPRNHPAISLSNQALADFVYQDGSTQDGRVDPLFSQPGRLNGIEGTLYCDIGNSCSTGSGVFGEGWYFTPAVANSRQTSLGFSPLQARYEDSDGDGTYELVRYVDYGMWLEGADDSLMLQRRIDVVGYSSPSNLDFDTPGTLTYTGEAHGLSARTTNAVTASGHFMADVELVAVFGPSPSMTGTIDNFRPAAGQGSGHVNTAWSLGLAIAGPLMKSESTGALSGVTNGKWTANPYGDSRSHPTGFYGEFTAVFDTGDGAAAGLYHADR